jgi:hypothetical protein
MARTERNASSDASRVADANRSKSTTGQAEPRFDEGRAAASTAPASPPSTVIGSPFCRLREL